METLAGKTGIGLALPARTATIRGKLLADHLFERHVSDPVLLPVLEIEVPPFVFVNRESFSFHGAAEQLTVPTLAGRSARVARKRTWREFVVAGHHLYRFTSLQIVQRQIHDAAAIVARPIGRVGNKVLHVARRRIPEHFRHVPRSVGIVDQQPKSPFF